jgi:antitoxin ChpS
LVLGGGGRSTEAYAAGGVFYWREIRRTTEATMTITARLRRSRGAVVLSIPKAIVQSMNLAAGSIVELAVEGHALTVVPVRRGLADRLARSPKSPTAWARDDEWLDDAAVGRELL